MPILEFTVERDCTLEEFLRRDCGLSRRQLCRLKHREGGILCGGRPVRSIDPVHAGQCVTLHMEDVSSIHPNPALHVPLCFADADVLIFDKPAGMPVHPSRDHRADTLGNAFAAQYPELTFRPVNRLDRNTSGLAAAARHSLAASRLPGQLQKTYFAVCEGHPPEKGTVCAPIARDPASIIKRRVSEDGKEAVTHFQVLERYGMYSLLRLTLETGRTHQIRVHLAHIGCPLAGDDLYGGSLRYIQRHALHCGEMVYTDVGGRVHTVSSPMPEDMQDLLSPADITA